MKKLIVIILILITSNIYSQQQSCDRAWDKATLRETPGTGETISIFGIGFISAGSISAFGIDNKLNRVSCILGGILVVTGVYIDINRNATKYKYKHKVKGSFFARFNAVGLQLTI